MEKGDCWCIKCTKKFLGHSGISRYDSKHYGEVRQDECLCNDCCNLLKEENLKYYGLDYTTPIYTAKLININHKLQKTCIEGKITKVEIYNYDRDWSLFNIKDKIDLPYCGSVSMKYQYKNFKPQDVSHLFTYIITTDDGKKYNRKLKDLYKSKDECIQYIDKSNGYKSSTNISELDMYIMGEQNLIYNTVSNFLKSDEAIQFNVTGVDIRVENGYVNADWKFGKREKGDIKNE